MKILTALIFILFPFFVSNVFACQCHYLNSVWTEFDDSTAVFVGKAVKQNLNLRENMSLEDYQKETQKEWVFDFEIEKAFKGVKNKNVKISLGTKNMCEDGFEIGETYLIYAGGENEENLYTRTFCSRNEKLESAQDQIFFINEKLNGKSEPQFYGSAELAVKENGIWKRKLLPDYKFYLNDGREKIEVITDRNGLFQINNLKKGIYDLSFAENSEYTLDFLFSARFRVLESGKAISFQSFDQYAFYKYSDELFEEVIRKSSHLVNNFYLEISLK